MRSTRLLVALALLSLGAATYADYVVVPNAYVNQMGSNGLNSPLRDQPRTFVEVMGQDQLGGIQVGNVITGITFRLWSGAGGSWPPSAATWSNYDIYMGKAAVNAGSLNATIANNYVAGTRQQVRGGSLTIPANAFGFATPVTPFSYEMTFTTPFTYTGGGLILEISHNGNNIGQAQFVDHPTEWGTGNHAGYNTSYNATTLAYMYPAPLTTRITYIPEPAAFALVALALLIRRR